MSARYSWGGDEHLFVELAEEMSLQAYFRAMAIATAAARAAPGRGPRDLPGQRLLPGPLRPGRARPARAARSSLQDVETDGRRRAATSRCETRIVEIPVLYDDPWTTETLMRFRDRHQDPDGDRLEYAARINGFEDVEEFIDAHSGSPWFASMVGFVAGLPFMYQMVPARAADRRPQVRAPAHRHAEADRRPRRLLLRASTPCAAPAATRCSASPRRRSTTPRQTLAGLRRLRGASSSRATS